jgi:hypothetical protein
VKASRPVAWKNGVDTHPFIDLYSGRPLAATGRRTPAYSVADFGSNGVLRLPYEPPDGVRLPDRLHAASAGSALVAAVLQRGGTRLLLGDGRVEQRERRLRLRGRKGEPGESDEFLLRASRRRPLHLGDPGAARSRHRAAGRPEDFRVAPLHGRDHDRPNWCVDLPNLIGLGNCDSFTRFEAVQIREISGKGASGAR